MKKPTISWRMICCLATCEDRGDYSVPRPVLVKKHGAATVKGVERRELVKEFLDGGLVLTEPGGLVLAAFRVGSNLHPDTARQVHGAAVDRKPRT